MEKKKLEKDIVFFTPGERGSIFTYQAGNFIDDNLLMSTIDHLKHDTEKNVEWIEDRRQIPRNV